MKQITLICVAGMSTSMMISRMKAAADSRNLDVQIQAMSESSFDTGGKQTDVLLLGPQIAYLEGQIRKKYEPEGIRISVIPAPLYGMMNGEAVLDIALNMMEG